MLTWGSGTNWAAFRGFRAPAGPQPFDLAPRLTKIIAHEDNRVQISERNRLRRLNQPPQTIKDDPVPPVLSEPEVSDATGPIKSRFVIERLPGNVNDGNIIINEAVGWLLYNAADVEKP